MIRDSTVLTIRVIPRAGKAGPAGMRDGVLVIKLNAPPVEGAANRELIDLLANLLDVPKRNISIVSDDRSRTKRVRVDGLTADDVARRLPGSRDD